MTVCLHVQRIDAVIHLCFFCTLKMMCSRDQEPASCYLKWDLYQAYSRHKVPLCVCQVPDCVCNVKVAVSDLDNTQEIKPNYRSKIGTEI